MIFHKGTPYVTHLLFLACMLQHSLAPAAVSVPAAAITPPSASVAPGTAASVNIIWRASSDLAGAVIRSPVGTFRAGNPAGPLLGTVPIILSKSVTQNVLTPFPESVLVPSDVVFRALKLGYNVINYTRVFDDGSGPVNGHFTITIRSSAAAGFNVTRIALAFDNGSSVRVAALNEKIQVSAEIGFTGSGSLQGLWEVAGPVAAGQPFFRPLAPVHQPLTMGNKQTLASADLPTETAGTYLLRLRITEPKPGFTEPVLRYVVLGARPAETRPLAVVAPANDVLLAPDTSFAWEPVRSARLYQLEIYAVSRNLTDSLPDLGAVGAPPATVPETSPLGGVLVAEPDTRTTLSAALRARLTPGARYRWRVVAIGDDGRIVGESATRELRVP